MAANLIAGAMFILMGIVTIVLGVTGTMLSLPGTTEIGILQARAEARLSAWAATPFGAAAGWALILGLATAAVLVFRRARRQRVLAAAAAVDAPP